MVEHVLNPLVDGRSDRPQLRLQIDELDGHKPDISPQKSPHTRPNRASSQITQGAMIWED